MHTRYMQQNYDCAQAAVAGKFTCMLKNELITAQATLCLQAKTHEKVDSLGENRSIACHTVCTLIRA